MIIVQIDISIDGDNLLIFVLKKLKNIQFSVDIAIHLCYTNNRSSE